MALIELEMLKRQLQGLHEKEIIGSGDSFWSVPVLNFKETRSHFGHDMLRTGVNWNLKTWIIN